MSSLFGAQTSHAARRRCFRAIAAASLIAVTAWSASLAVVQAERLATRTYSAKSGFNSFFARHVVRLTVFEAGAATINSRAIIELRDRANQVVARKEAPLARNTPVQLDLKLGDNAGLVQLRAVVTVTNDNGDLTTPLVTFEDINPDLGLAIKIDPPCGPGSGPADPQANCGGWLVFTTVQN